jgi:predicted negative regulator of RcsB-dependent stress response
VAKKITQKSLKRDEFIDAAFDFGNWLEQNWAKVAKWLLAGFVAVTTIVAWSAYSRHSRAQLQDFLAQGIHLYEDAEADDFADSAGLSTALETFDDAARRGGSGATGTLARFYRGSTLFHLGRHDEAVTSFQEVVEKSGPGDTLGDTARIMLARVYVAAGRSDEAIQLLQSVAEQEDPIVPPELALLELGRIHEETGDSEEARRTWQRVVDDHPLTVSASEARRLLQ